MVSGLVSEKMGCNENPFQTFGAMETIVFRGRGELCRLEGLMKTCDSWGAGGKPLSTGGPPEARLGCRGRSSMGWAVAAVVDEGRAGKTEVARGGWAEDARRPPATSLVCVVIPFAGLG